MVWLPYGNILRRTCHRFRDMYFPVALALFIFAALVMSGETRPVRLNETPVPDYMLPDPLECTDGARVKDADAWRMHRRSELLELFAREVYGRTLLGRPEGAHAEVTSSSGRLSAAAQREKKLRSGSRPGGLVRRCICCYLCLTSPARRAGGGRCSSD